MKKSVAVPAVLAGVVLIVLAITMSAGAGSRSATRVASESKVHSDHGLFCTCSSPADTAVYASANRSYTLYISGSAGSDGTFVINFHDGDNMTFKVPSGTTLSTTQALGGVPGVDDIVKITATGGVTSMMVSVMADQGAKDPFYERLDGGTRTNDNYVVTAPGEDGVTSAVGIFGS